MKFKLLFTKIVALIVAFNFTLTSTISYGDFPQTVSANYPDRISHAKQMSFVNELGPAGVRSELGMARAVNSRQSIVDSRPLKEEMVASSKLPEVTRRSELRNETKQNEDVEIFFWDKSPLLYFIALIKQARFSYIVSLVSFSVFLALEFFSEKPSERTMSILLTAGAYFLYRIVGSFLHEMGHFWAHRVFGINEQFFGMFKKYVMRGVFFRFDGVVTAKSKAAMLPAWQRKVCTVAGFLLAGTVSLAGGIFVWFVVGNRPMAWALFLYAVREFSISAVFEFLAERWQSSRSNGVFDPALEEETLRRIGEIVASRKNTRAELRRHVLDLSSPILDLDDQQSTQNPKSKTQNQDRSELLSSERQVPNETPKPLGFGAESSEKIARAELRSANLRDSRGVLRALARSTDKNEFARAELRSSTLERFHVSSFEGTGDRAFAKSERQSKAELRETVTDSSELRRDSQRPEGRLSLQRSQMRGGIEGQSGLPKRSLLPESFSREVMNGGDFLRAFGAAGLFSFGRRAVTLDRTGGNFRTRRFSRMKVGKEVVDRSVSQLAALLLVLGCQALFLLPLFRPKVKLAGINRGAGFQKEGEIQEFTGFGSAQLFHNDIQFAGNSSPDFHERNHNITPLPHQQQIGDSTRSELRSPDRQDLGGVPDTSVAGKKSVPQVPTEIPPTSVGKTEGFHQVSIAPPIAARAELRQNRAGSGRSPSPRSAARAELRGSKKYPDPVGFKYDSGFAYTHLNRYENQVHEFTTNILPILIKKYNQDRIIRIAIMGSSTGEESATLMAAILETFAAHPEWGKIQDWQVLILNVDSDSETNVEAASRIAGHSPFVFNSGRAAELFGKDYWQRVSRTIAILNRYRDYVRRNILPYTSSFSSAKLLSRISHYDAVFFNAVPIPKSKWGRNRAWRLLRQYFGNSFLIGTTLSDARTGFKKTHKIVLRAESPRLIHLPYLIAIPKWAQAEWKELRRSELRQASKREQNGRRRTSKPSERKRYSVNAILEGIIQQVIQDANKFPRISKGIRFSFNDKAPETFLDLKSYTSPRRSPLYDIVLEVFANAVKYSYPDNTVEITLESDAANIVIKIKDSGIGISPEDIGKIGKLGFRTAAAQAHTAGFGTGVRRSIRALTKHYYGNLRIESEGVGKGTTATITLPIPRAELRLVSSEPSMVPLQPNAAKAELRNERLNHLIRKLNQKLGNIDETQIRDSFRLARKLVRPSARKDVLGRALNVSEILVEEYLPLSGVTNRQEILDLISATLLQDAFHEVRAKSKGKNRSQAEASAKREISKITDERVADLVLQLTTPMTPPDLMPDKSVWGYNEKAEYAKWRKNDELHDQQILASPASIRPLAHLIRLAVYDERQRRELGVWFDQYWHGRSWQTGSPYNNFRAPYELSRSMQFVERADALAQPVKDQFMRHLFQNIAGLNPEKLIEEFQSSLAYESIQKSSGQLLLKLSETHFDLVFQRLINYGLGWHLAKEHSAAAWTILTKLAATESGFEQIEKTPRYSPTVISLLSSAIGSIRNPDSLRTFIAHLITAEGTIFENYEQIKEARTSISAAEARLNQILSREETQKVIAQAHAEAMRPLLRLLKHPSKNQSYFLHNVAQAVKMIPDERTDLLLAAYSVLYFYRDKDAQSAIQTIESRLQKVLPNDAARLLGALAIKKLRRFYRSTRVLHQNILSFPTYSISYRSTEESIDMERHLENAFETMRSAVPRLPANDETLNLLQEILPSVVKCDAVGSMLAGDPAKRLLLEIEFKIEECLGLATAKSRAKLLISREKKYIYELSYRTKAVRARVGKAYLMILKEMLLAHRWGKEYNERFYEKIKLVEDRVKETLGEEAAKKEIGEVYLEALPTIIVSGARYSTDLSAAHGIPAFAIQKIKGNTPVEPKEKLGRAYVDALGVLGTESDMRQYKDGHFSFHYAIDSIEKQIIDYLGGIEGRKEIAGVYRQHLLAPIARGADPEGFVKTRGAILGKIWEYLPQAETAKVSDAYRDMTKAAVAILASDAPINKKDYFVRHRSRDDYERIYNRGEEQVAASHFDDRIGAFFFIEDMVRKGVLDSDQVVTIAPYFLNWMAAQLSPIRFQAEETFKAITEHARTKLSRQARETIGNLLIQKLPSSMKETLKESRNHLISLDVRTVVNLIEQFLGKDLAKQRIQSVLQKDIEEMRNLCLKAFWNGYAKEIAQLVMKVILETDPVFANLPYVNHLTVKEQLALYDVLPKILAKEQDEEARCREIAKALRERKIWDADAYEKTAAIFGYQPIFSFGLADASSADPDYALLRNRNHLSSLAEVADGFSISKAQFNGVADFEDKLKSAQSEIKGRFDQNNPWHLAANYHSIHLEGQQAKATRQLTVEEYKQMIMNPSTLVQSQISAEDRIQLKVLTYEAYKLREFLNELKKSAAREGRNVVVVANKSYGLMAIAPIRQWLDQNGISVIETKIASSDAHGDPFVIDYDDRPLFTDDQVRMFANEKPTVVVVDGSYSLDHGKIQQFRRHDPRFPDAYQGYRNFMIAVNEGMQHEDVAQDMVEFQKDAEFLKKLKENDKFKEVVKKVRQIMQPNSQEHYKMRFWTPAFDSVDGKLKFSERNKIRTDRAPPIFDFNKDTVGPTLIMVQSAIENRRSPAADPAHPTIPPQIMEWFGGENIPAYFDDKDNFKRFYYTFDPDYGLIVSKLYAQASEHYYHELLELLGEEQMSRPRAVSSVAVKSIDGYVFDLTGTLAKFKGKISPLVKEKIELLLRLGKKVAIVTDDTEAHDIQGRVIDQIDPRLRKNLSIYLNGGNTLWKFDEAGKKQVVFDELMNPEIKERVEKFAERTLFDSGLNGNEFHFDPARHLVSIDLTNYLHGKRDRDGKRRDIITKLESNLQNETGIAARIYLLGRHHVVIRLKHKAHAVRDFISREDIKQERLLLAGDEAGSRRIDRELFKEFAGAIKINVGRISHSLKHKATPQTYQVSGTHSSEGTENIQHLMNAINRDGNLVMPLLESHFDAVVEEQSGEREGEGAIVRAELRNLAPEKEKSRSELRTVSGKFIPMVPAHVPSGSVWVFVVGGKIFIRHNMGSDFDFETMKANTPLSHPLKQASVDQVNIGTLSLLEPSLQQIVRTAPERLIESFEPSESERFKITLFPAVQNERDARVLTGKELDPFESLRRAIRDLSTQEGVEVVQAGLIGSFGYGSATAGEEDVDIYLVTKEPLEYTRLGQLIQIGWNQNESIPAEWRAKRLEVHAYSEKHLEIAMALIAQRNKSKSSDKTFNEEKMQALIVPSGETSEQAKERISRSRAINLARILFGESRISLIDEVGEPRSELRSPDRQDLDGVPDTSVAGKKSVPQVPTETLEPPGYSVESDHPVSSETSKPLGFDAGGRVEHSELRSDETSQIFHQFAEWVKQNHKLKLQTKYGQVEAIIEVDQEFPFKDEQRLLIWPSQDWIGRMPQYAQYLTKSRKPYGKANDSLVPKPGSFGQVILKQDHLVLAGGEEQRVLLIKEIQPRFGYGDIPKSIRRELDLLRDAVIQRVAEFSESYHLLLFGRIPQEPDRIKTPNYIRPYERLGWNRDRVSMRFFLTQEFWIAPHNHSLLTRADLRTATSETQFHAESEESRRSKLRQGNQLKVNREELRVPGTGNSSLLTSHSSPLLPRAELRRILPSKTQAATIEQAFKELDVRNSSDRETEEETERVLGQIQEALLSEEGQQLKTDADLLGIDVTKGGELAKEIQQTSVYTLLPNAASDPSVALAFALRFGKQVPVVILARTPQESARISAQIPEGYRVIVVTRANAPSVFKALQGRIRMDAFGVSSSDRRYAKVQLEKLLKYFVTPHISKDFDELGFALGLNGFIETLRAELRTLSMQLSAA